MRGAQEVPPPLRSGGGGGEADGGGRPIAALGCSPLHHTSRGPPPPLRRGGAAVAAIVALLLAGCDLTMTKQPKYGPQVSAGLFPDGTSAQTPPADTVAQTAVPDAEAAAAPPPVTLALVQRGQERHEIFCKPCHGVSGEGDGTIVLRGFPRPPSYADDRVRDATPQHLFQVITNGYGVMYPYAERIPPADRWAIIAYVRALEVARDQGAPDVKPPKGSSGGPA